MYKYSILGCLCERAACTEQCCGPGNPADGDGPSSPAAARLATGLAARMPSAAARGPDCPAGKSSCRVDASLGARVAPLLEFHTHCTIVESSRVASHRVGTRERSQLNRFELRCSSTRLDSRRGIRRAIQVLYTECTKNSIRLK